jgi:hypothetical protein
MVALALAELLLADESFVVPLPLLEPQPAIAAATPRVPRPSQDRRVVFTVAPFLLMEDGSWESPDAPWTT